MTSKKMMRDFQLLVHLVGVEGYRRLLSLEPGDHVKADDLHIYKRGSVETGCRVKGAVVSVWNNPMNREGSRCLFQGTCPLGPVGWIHYPS